MKTILALAVGLIVLVTVSACGSTSKPKTVTLTPGRYHYQLGDQLNTGDSVRCVTAAGKAAGGGDVPRAGNGVGSSTGFELAVAKDGSITITCPHRVGIM